VSGALLVEQRKLGCPYAATALSLSPLIAARPERSVGMVKRASFMWCA